MSRLGAKNNKIPTYSDREPVTKPKIVDVAHPIQRDLKSKSTNEERSTRGLGMQTLTFVFYIFFLTLFLVAFYRYTAGMPVPTFTGLLNFIQSCPNVTLDPHFLGTISADWGVFNFLRDFINTLSTILGVGMYGCSCITQVILIVAWFIAWAFAIV